MAMVEQERADPRRNTQRMPAEDPQTIALRRHVQAQQEVIQSIIKEAGVDEKESTLTPAERAAVKDIFYTPRYMGVAFGGIAGAGAASTLRMLNPAKFKQRASFWFWVGPAFVLGFTQGAQTGSQRVMRNLLNLPNSPFADQIRTHLETYAPRSGWLDLIESKPNAVTVPDDSWQDDQALALPAPRPPLGRGLTALPADPAPATASEGKATPELEAANEFDLSFDDDGGGDDTAAPGTLTASGWGGAFQMFGGGGGPTGTVAEEGAGPEQHGRRGGRRNSIPAQQQGADEGWWDGEEEARPDADAPHERRRGGWAHVRRNRRRKADEESEPRERVRRADSGPSDT